MPNTTLRQPSAEIGSTPSPLLLRLACALAIVFAPIAVSAATYYVRATGSDANPGTTGSPWLTIQKAANVMVAGDTTIVGDGTYTSGTIFFNTSGAAGMPITLQAENKRLAVLEFNGNLTGTNCQPQLSVSAGYVIFKDLRLTVSASNTQCATGITSASASGIKFWQQYRAHSPSYPGGCPGGETCNGTTGWVNSQSIGMQIDYNATRGDAIGSQQDGTVTDGCLCYGEVMNYGGLGVIVRNSRILAPGNVGGSFVQSKGESRNTQIYNNIIVMDGSQYAGRGWAGLILGGDAPQQPSFTGSAVTCWNCVAYNNYVYTTGTNAAGDGTNVAMGVQGAQNSKMFNNVLVGNGKLQLDSASTGNAFYNNIMQGTGQAAMLSWGNTTAGETFDYNDFYNVTGAPSQAHPIMGDPLLLIPASDAHLGAGSPAINTGTPVTMTGYNGETIDVSKTFDGLPRSIPWDLGLYDTGGTPAVDSQAPSIPAGLTAAAASSSQIDLSWSASTDNVGVSGYRVFRAGAQIATVTGTSYSNTSLSASTAYSYTVAAYDAATNVSAQSASASAATLAPGAGPSVTLSVAGAPNLPLNGTTAAVTVGFAFGTPVKIDLSRDGQAAFATWPSGAFFTLSADGRSLTGNWCISSGCWGGVGGAHVLNVLATYADGTTAAAAVTLNVSDTPPPSLSCDANGDSVPNVVDVQLGVNQALGSAACVLDLNKDGACNIVDVQRIVNAAMGGPCVIGP